MVPPSDNPPPADIPLDDDIPLSHASDLRFRFDTDLGPTEWGHLYRATDLDTQSPVTLLDLLPDLQHSKRALRAIRDGIERAADFHDPRLSAVRQLLVVGNRMFLLADPLPGVPPPLPYPPDALPALAADVAALLDPLHEAGLVHGNLRPTSFSIDDSGHLAALAGFGLPFLPLRPASRRAAAPELARPRWEPDSASDQYALATAFFALLTGHFPPPPAHGHAPDLSSLPSSCPPAFRSAFHRALSPNPRSRFASLSDFAEALAGHRVLRRRKPSPQERRAVRRRILLTLATLAALALVGLLSWSAYIGIRRLAEEPPPAPPPPKIDPSLAVPILATVERFTDTPPLATPGSHWVSSDGMEFVWIESLGLWVGRFEVANEEYHWFDPDHENRPFRELPMDDPRQPAVRLNFQEMMQFADWLTERESSLSRIPPGWAFRLPTRREAVTFTLAGRPASFPWGDTWPPLYGNFADLTFHQNFPDLPSIPDYRDTFPVSAPVEKTGENDWGLFGTCGNVWETCAADETAKAFGGWHGGAFDDARPDRCGAASFYGYLGTARGSLNGFRLVLAPLPADPAP